MKHNSIVPRPLTCQNWGLWAASSSLQSLQNKRYWCDHYSFWRDTREEILMSNIQKRIRFVNSDGPSVPMLVLEPTGKDVILMVLWIRISLRGLWLFSQFRWSINTTGKIDTNRKVELNVIELISQRRARNLSAWRSLGVRERLAWSASRPVALCRFMAWRYSIRNHFRAFGDDWASDRVIGAMRAPLHVLVVLFCSAYRACSCSLLFKAFRRDLLPIVSVVRSEVIQFIGPWSRDAYQLYIRTPIFSLTQISCQLT